MTIFVLVLSVWWPLEAAREPTFEWHLADGDDRLLTNHAACVAWARERGLSFHGARLVRFDCVPDPSLRAMLSEPPEEP